MFTKLPFHLRPWLILLVIPFLLFACASGMEPKIPLSNGIPNDDIVFMPANPVVDVDIDPNGKTMGFINDDGTNKVMYAFTMFGGTRSNFGMRLSNRVALYPRWSKSGTMLVFQIASTPVVATWLIRSNLHSKKHSASDNPVLSTIRPAMHRLLPNT